MKSDIELLGFSLEIWGYAATNIGCIAIAFLLCNKNRLPFLKPGGIREWSFMGAVLFSLFSFCNKAFQIPVVILSGNEDFDKQIYGHVITSVLFFIVFGITFLFPRRS